MTRFPNISLAAHTGVANQGEVAVNMGFQPGGRLVETELPSSTNAYGTEQRKLEQGDRWAGLGGVQGERHKGQQAGQC